MFLQNGKRISTQNADLIPNVDILKKLLQSLATLDLIMLTEDWEDRYYNFNSNWSPGVEAGMMRNGSGDEFHAMFNDAGCIITGFDHESIMSPHRVKPPELWPGLLEGVPDEFAEAINEPAFSISSITFCLWRRYGDSNWSHGPIDFPEGENVDGTADLFVIFDGQPERYSEYAQDYFEQVLPIDSVRHVYSHNPLTNKIIASLNPDTEFSEIEEFLVEIGYP